MRENFVTFAPLNKSIMKKNIFLFAILFHLIIRLDAQSNDSSQNKFQIKQSGFTSINEIGTNLFGSDDRAFLFRSINGYLINPNISLAIGIEIDNLRDLLTYPLFLDLRWSLIKEFMSPLIYLDAGYSGASSKSNTGNNYSGGYYYALGMGIKVFISNSVYLISDIGFFNQAVTYTYSLGHSGINLRYNSEMDNINGVVIRLGIGF